jgi:steroid delta-isomerase-like uncharacterized protein
MSAEENTALVRRFLEAAREDWTPAMMDEFFAPDYRRHLSASAAPITAEAHRQRVTRLRAAFPDARTTLEDIVADGDRVAFRLTIRGTHQGAFLGLAPTGKAIEVSFLGIVRVAGGRLVEEWGGLDQADLFRQLGASAIRDT